MIECAPEIDALYARCAQTAPNYGVTRDEFLAAIRTAADKYLVSATDQAPSAADLRPFLSELLVADLYLALACARGNEHAWWDFDASYRRYIERITRHLASAETDSEDVVDHVYTELYGTQVVDGVRKSKFATYMGRGSLRGWLRAIVWHAVVDKHRERPDEVWIDEWAESGGEAQDRPGWRAEAQASESVMIDRLARERYTGLTAAALEAALGGLEAHEKLLLLYYHVEGLKLREIARLVEEPRSVLRRWFQRRSKRRLAEPASRVHESTVMRWLEKVYGKVLEKFRAELGASGLVAEEIEACLEIAAESLAAEDLSRHLTQISADDLSKDERN